MDFLVKQLLNRSSDRISIIGNNRTGSVIPLSSVQNHLYQDYSGVFILDKQGDDVIPGGQYLTITYRGDCSQNASYIPMLLDYAASHDLIPCGDCLELLWTDIHQSQDEQEYLTELQLLCKSNPKTGSQ